SSSSKSALIKIPEADLLAIVMACFKLIFAACAARTSSTLVAALAAVVMTPVLKANVRQAPNVVSLKPLRILFIISSPYSYFYLLLSILSTVFFIQLYRFSYHNADEIDLCSKKVSLCIIIVYSQKNRAYPRG